MSTPIHRALIIGPGAVGSVLGLELKRTGFKVTYLGKQGPVTHACEIETQAGTELFDTPLPGQAEFSSALVFITLKAFALSNALNQHLPLLAPDTTVVSLGNGYLEPHLEAAAAQFPQMKFRLGISTFGVTELGSKHYSLRAAGKFAWGSFLPVLGTTDIEQFALRTGRAFHWLDDARAVARKKWLFNTVLNSVSAAYRIVNNKMALEAPRLRLVFREAFQLGAELWGNWPQTEAELFTELQALASLTAQNENSAAQSVRLGRPTETEFLAGLARGREEYPELRQLDSLLSKNES